MDTIVRGALGCAEVGFPVSTAATQEPRPLASEEAAWATGAVSNPGRWLGQRERPQWAGCTRPLGR